MNRKQVVPCDTDEGHWDVVQADNLVMYHSCSYIDCQAFAFGMRPNGEFMLYSEKLARIVDHKVPSGV